MFDSTDHFKSTQILSSVTTTKSSKNNSNQQQSADQRFIDSGPPEFDLIATEQQLNLTSELEQMDEDEEYVEHDLDGTDDDSEDSDDEEEDDTESSEAEEGEEDESSDEDHSNEDEQNSAATRRRKRSKKGGGKSSLAGGGADLAVRDNKPKSFQYLDLSKKCEAANAFDSMDFSAANCKQIHEQNFLTIMQKDELTAQMQEGKIEKKNFNFFLLLIDWLDFYFICLVLVACKDNVNY